MATFYFDAADGVKTKFKTSSNGWGTYTDTSMYIHGSNVEIICKTADGTIFYNTINPALDDVVITGVGAATLTHPQSADTVFNSINPLFKKAAATASPTAIDASLVTTGTLNDARLSTGVKSKLFSYLITKVSSTYFSFDSSGATAFSGANASTVINSTIAALTTGGTIAIAKADYTIPTSIIDAGNSNVNLVFAKGAKFIAGAALDKPVIYLTSVSHWRIYNPEIDGNASNQTAPQVSGAPTIIPDGIGASTCNDVIIYDAYVHDVRRFGVNFDESSTSSGIINSYVTLCGWNGINLGNHTTDLDLFAFNNDVSFCGDVGIAHYGIGCRTTGNSIHDITGTTGSNGQGYGITIEGGGDNQIADNRISNCKGAGIYGITAFESNKITGNKIYQWDSGQTSAPAIHMYSEYNLIADNVLNSSRTIGMGIKLDNATNNTVSNNYLTCKRPIWLQTNANNNYIFGNTCKSVPAPIHIEDSTCTGNKIDYNDLTASSASIEDAGTGTIIGFNYYSGGSLHVPSGLAAETTTTIGTLINGATSKATPVDADQLGLVDSAGSNILKQLSWANLKATVKTYFDTLYQALLVSGTNIKTINGSSVLGSGNLTVSGSATDVDDVFILASQALGSTIKDITTGINFSQSVTSLSLTDGILYVVPVFVKQGGTRTGIKIIINTAGVYTGDNENRVGLTSVSAGTHTLVASNANNANLWTAAAGMLTIPFSSPVSVSADTMYFVNILYNNSAQTTAPAILASTNYNSTAWSALATDFTNSNRLYGSRSSGTLLSSFAASTLGQPSSNIPLVMLY